MKKPVVVPTNWTDPLMTGKHRVIGDPPYYCPDVEKLLLAIKKRYDKTVGDIAKSERARVRRMVRAVKTGSMLKYRPLAGAALASYREACDDILDKLTEASCQK